MPLSDWTEERADIELPNGGSFSVRGLSLADAGLLIRMYRDDIDQLRTAFVGVDPRNTDAMAETALQVASELTRTAPEMVATIIAAAADEPTAYEKAARLPLPIQAKVLTEIGRLTFVDAAGLKKFIADVTTLVRELFGSRPESAPALNQSPRKRKRLVG